MLKLYFLGAIGQNTKPYEIVVAIIIILFTIGILFFLYKNVARELQAWKEQRESMAGKDKDKIEEGSADKIRETDTLLEIIDKKIRTADEGDLAIFFAIDIDDFGYIVDKYPKKQVDKVINEVAKRLRKFAGKNSFSGNIKEDSFVFYYIGEVDNDIIEQIAKQLLEVISQPLKTVDEALTCSIGTAIFPYDGSNSENLNRNANLALYVAKKEGKNTYHLYSEDLLEKEQFNISYYQEIKRSIENDEFLLYYQPIVDIKTGTIIGFESLLRWNHPTMGILPPGKFLNVMDLSGDIAWFGTWGFDKIVKQYKEWRERIRFRDLFISTNLSPKQMVIEGLAHQFYNITKKQGISADLFCMEIIDYYTIINNPIAIHNLNEFRKFGFRIAIDDLGDNYQITRDMANVKAGIVKISRNNLLKVFDNTDESEKIHKVVDVAQKAQKIVIVEGIEDEKMIQRMIPWNLRFMQGYHFSQAISSEMAEEMLVRSPWNMTTFNHLFANEEVSA